MSGGKCHVVKLSSKLDIIQELAREHADNPYKIYLIGLLTEHAEEAEMTAELLKWISDVLT